MATTLRPCMRVSEPRPVARKKRPAVTPSEPAPQPADRDLGEPGRNEDERLDEALEETMPGSDPISVHIEEPGENDLKQCSWNPPA